MRPSPANLVGVLAVLGLALAALVALSWRVVAPRSSSQSGAAAALHDSVLTPGEALALADQNPESQPLPPGALRAAFTTVQSACADSTPPLAALSPAPDQARVLLDAPKQSPPHHS